MPKIEHLRNNYNNRLQTCTIWLIFAVFILFVHLLLSSRYDQIRQQYVYWKEAAAPTEKVVDLNYVEDHLYSLDQTNVELIQYTRFKYLTPPSRLPYNLQQSGNYKDEFAVWVEEFFGNKTDGIFIEAGAHEGEVGSHTLYLEQTLGWNGLLVECNPTIVPYLKSHHRKAWIASVCLAPSSTPGVLNFSNPLNWTYSGTFKKPWNLPVPTEWKFFDVDTMPLYTLIAALGWTEIDYFSFDIEGMELAVLKIFPFHLITFKVLIIEIMFYTVEEKKELDELLQNNGYIFVKDVQVDKIYVHNSVKHMLNQTAVNS